MAEEACDKMQKEVVLMKKNVGENESYLMRLKVFQDWIN